MLDKEKIDALFSGKSKQCFVIAEAGVNHNGNVSLAYKLINAAVEARADAVKFQTFKAEKVASTSTSKAEYQKKTSGADESQVAMLKRLELPQSAHKELLDYCKKKGILFLSTPFEKESADFLNEIHLELFKISSGDLTNLPFLEHVANKQKAIILSTGMGNLDEVTKAVACIKKTGNKNLILLHCVSNYPANPSNVNLRAMKTMKDEFNIPVGYSDHTLGIEIALAAVSLGACVIEKHFTLDNNLSGPDHKTSLDPDALKKMITGIRLVESALGDGNKVPCKSENAIAEVARKSLINNCDINIGDIVTENMFEAKRPGTGLAPSALSEIIGKKAKASIKTGTLISQEMFE